MQVDSATERQQAHALLDGLPADKLSAVRSLLELLVEPLSRSLASVPVEAEELTPEVARAFFMRRECVSSACEPRFSHWPILNRVVA